MSCTSAAIVSALLYSGITKLRAGGALTPARSWMRGGRREERRHRGERAAELLPAAGEAEPDVPFAVRAEVRARHAADTAAGDQVFRHRPGDRRRSRSAGRTPRGIDPEERVECAGRRLAAEGAVRRFPD